MVVVVVRKQSKKTIQSLQMSPRMASLRQGMYSFLPSYHSQVDRVLNKGTLTVRQRGRIL